MSEGKKKAAALSVIALIIILMGLVFYFIGVPLVRYVGEPEKFREIVDNNMLLGRIGFIGMSILQVIVAVIPGEPFEILAGYAFGAIEGTLLCLISQTFGSMLIFMLVRKFGYKLVGVFYSKEKINSLRFLKFSPKRDMIFLIIFMIPGTPKDLITYFAGLTDIKTAVWLVICSLGRAPAIITSSVGGNALGTENYLFAILVFVITMAVSLGGIWGYNVICSKHRKNKKEK